MRLLDRSKYEIRTAWSIFTNLYYHGNDEQKISKTLKKVQYDFGKHGWRRGESARLPRMWPGFDSWTRRHKWVEFVKTLLRLRGFSTDTRIPRSYFSLPN